MVNISDFFPSVADRIKNIGKLKNKKVLITGANGVIGNHLIPTLKDAGADIYIMVFNNIPYSCLPCKDNSIKTYTFKQEHKFDYIIHLAGYGQPRKFSEDKLTTIYLNTTAIFQLFNVLKEGGSFLFASTSEVYSGLEGLVDETMIGTTGPSHPRACYIESKRCGEAIVRAAQDKFNGKITRISLVYGPGVSYYDTRVMSDFIRSSLEKGFISPKGGLDNIRTYC